MTHFRKRKNGSAKQKGKVFPIGGSFTPKKFQAERSLASKRLDNRLKAPITDDIEKWAKDPGHSDLQGIDTPVKVVRKKLGIRKHLLLTEEMKKTIPKLYSQENVKDPIVYAKFFDPTSNWTWYATEFDGEDRFFGLVDGHEKEMGYFSLAELEKVRGRFGLPIERDMYFKSTKLSNIQNPGKKESDLKINNPSSVSLKKDALALKISTPKGWEVNGSQDWVKRDDKNKIRSIVSIDTGLLGSNWFLDVTNLFGKDNSFKRDYPSKEDALEAAEDYMMRGINKSSKNVSSSVQISDVEKNKLRKSFLNREARNYHTENALMLINRFGTEQEKVDAKEKYKKFKNSKMGISHEDHKWFYENSSKHFSKIGFQ